MFAAPAYLADPALASSGYAFSFGVPAKGPRAGEIDKVLKALATVLDALQPVRNRASVAHPNKELLAAPEAMLVVNAGRTILHYLDAKLV